jgi:hypothetical protein
LTRFAGPSRLTRLGCVIKERVVLLRRCSKGREKYLGKLLDVQLGCALHLLISIIEKGRKFSRSYQNDHRLDRQA